MKRIKALIIENWQLKSLSLLLALSLWFWVNLSGKVPLILSKDVQLVNENVNYEYRLQAKRVRMKLYIPQGTKINSIAEDVKAYVDVSGLKPGEYLLSIRVDTKFKFMVKVEEIDPEYTKVFIKEKPRMGQ